MFGERRDKKDVFVGEAAWKRTNLKVLHSWLSVGTKRRPRGPERRHVTLNGPRCHVTMTDGEQRGKYNDWIKCLFLTKA